MSALHAEWTKLRTSPGTLGLLLAVVVTTAAVSILAISTVPCRVAGCGVDPAKVSLTGVMLGQAVVAILAVLTIGNEYSNGMVRTTLTAIPKRATMLGAKAAVLLAVMAAAATAAVGASLLAARLLWDSPGEPQLSLGDGAVLRAAIGSVLYLALIALFSLGIGAVVRNSATAIGVVLGLLYVFPIVAQAASDPDWQRRLQQIGPMSAGLAIQDTSGLPELPLSPWAGLGVLALWATGALITGGTTLKLRDA